jgi:hypothetical protein
MSTPAPLPPAAAPWYRSAVLQGILVAVIAQGLLRLKTQFGVDLSIYGLDANGLANWAMDIVSALALSYATRARLTQKAAPQITLTKAKADSLNAPQLSENPK